MKLNCALKARQPIQQIHLRYVDKFIFKNVLEEFYFVFLVQNVNLSLYSRNLLIQRKIWTSHYQSVSRLKTAELQATITDDYLANYVVFKELLILAPMLSKDSCPETTIYYLKKKTTKKVSLAFSQMYLLF